MTPPIPSRCPTEEAFASFLAGDLPKDAQQRLEEHIDGCARCRELLAHLGRETAPVLVAFAPTLAERRQGEPRGLKRGREAELPAGVLIAGRFEIGELVATGGMGSIYRARDRHNAETVAIKVLAELAEGALERFEREALILAELRHAGIARYIAHGPLASVGQGRGHQAGGRAPGFFLAMEWIEGEDLAERLRRGAIGWQDSVVLVARVASALAVAHARGIVHRDLKPSNVFLRTGRVDDTVLLDFGVARLTSADTTLTTAGLLIGTPAYMAPEQAAAGNSVDARADVFALGCLLFECITGERLFRAQSLQALLAKIVMDDPPLLRTIVPSAPEALERVLAWMLAKAPDDRPRDAAEVERALARTGLPVTPSMLPSEVTRPALGRGEQRVYSVVVAIPGEGESAVSLGGRGRASLAAQGGRVESLADGSLLVTVGGLGAPTDQAGRAARTALTLRDLLTRDAPIALATGWGDAIAVYPMGDALDRAGELLEKPPPAAAEGTLRPIRVDDATRSLLDVQFDVGEDEWSGLLRAATHTTATRTLLGRPTPCVGREAELAILDALVVQSAEESVARAAVVTGAAGIGKSRLREEFLRRIGRSHRESPGPQVWIARGDPMRAGSTLGLIAEAVGATAGLYAGEPLEVSQEKLTARVARHVAPGEVDRVTEFLGELVGTRFSDQGRPQLRAARVNATLMGDSTRRAWLDFVRAECTAGPLLIVLEDLHWGDPVTVDLIDTTLAVLAELPLAVVAMGRPETLELFPELWSRRSPQLLRLGRLSRTAAERLAREVLGASVAADKVQRIIELSEGNAFYLEELLRAVAEGRGEALPPNVVAMAQARVGPLDADLRHLLRAASVFGRTFWWGGVKALVGEGAALDRMEELVRAELVTVRPTARIYGEYELAFRHALVREAAYAMLTEADRALGHRLAAEWLERAGERDAMTLAEHLERGGDGKGAASWYRRAAMDAALGHDYASALSRAARGIACGPSEVDRPLLALAQAEAHRHRGENALAHSRAREAMQGLELYDPAWYAAAREAGVSAGNLADLEGVRELATAVRPRSGEGAPSTEALVAAASLAAELVVIGPEHARACLEDVAAATGPNELTAWAHIHHARSACSYVEGGLIDYLDHVSKAMDTFGRIGDVRGYSRALVNLGVGHGMLGEWEEAEASSRRALGLADGAGLGFVSALARHNLGLPLIRLGRVEEGLIELRASLETFRAQEHRRLFLGTHEHMAVALAALGDLALAEAHAEIAVDLGRAGDLAPTRPLAVLSLIRLDRGDAQGALRAAEEALATREGGASPAFVRLAHAEALAALGERERAQESALVGKEWLMTRAASIVDARRRESFLTRVPEHSRLLRNAAR